MNGSGSFTINGLGFGATKGAGQVTLDGTIVLPTTAWTDQQIDVTVPAGTPAGPHQLKVTANNGQTHRQRPDLPRAAHHRSPFPAGAVLDDFNRSTASTNQTLGGNWGGRPLVAAHAQLPDHAERTGREPRTRPSSAPPAGTSTGAAARPSAPTRTPTSRFTKAVATGVEPPAAACCSRSVRAASAALNELRQRVRYNATAGSVTVTRPRPPPAGADAPVTRATFPGVTFAAGDRLGARALADGTVSVYKNGATSDRHDQRVRLPRRRPADRRPDFAGSALPAFNTPNDVRFDNFGGGNVAVLAGGYNPNVYEVGPGRTVRDDPGRARRRVRQHAATTSSSSTPGSPTWPTRGTTRAAPTTRT